MPYILLTETVASCCPMTGACVPYTMTGAGSTRVATGIGIGVGCSTEESQTLLDTAPPVVSGSTANSETDPKGVAKQDFRERTVAPCLHDPLRWCLSHNARRHWSGSPRLH